MGVYIKGMRMPENCAECPCLRHDSIDGVNAYQCNITFGIRKSIDRKPKWCPLVDLGKHGDLIDRDEVRNAVFHHLSIKGEENLLPAEKLAFGNIIKAKAVIEAEDGT